MNFLKLKPLFGRVQIAVIAVVMLGCPHSVCVPDVVGQVHLDALWRIADAGLVVGTIGEEYSDSIEVGVVIIQSPAADSNVLPGSPVDMVVSRGALVTGTTETCMLPGDVPLEMVYIEPGTFMMGAYSGEQAAESDEYPQHEVTLTQGYWMGKYEVTKAQWIAVMGTEYWSGQNYVLNDPDSPACYIAWLVTRTFLTNLNDLTGKTFRLPTEAEWEYAARAGSTTRFYWGDDLDHMVGNDYAWWQHNSWNVNERYAHVTGLKMPNAWGLYDMLGNVWEWCEDSYRGDYYADSPNVDPIGPPPTGVNRLLRGGSFGSNGSYSRSAKRLHYDWGIATASFGFRLAR